MLKVLIADDEVHICRLIFALANWEELGMEVLGTVNDGPEALAKIQNEKPDILITDIRMPGLSGLLLIEKVLEINPEIEVIIISGYAQFDYAQTAIKMGVNDYLLKPISKIELNETLEKLGKRCREKNNIVFEVEKLRQDNQENIQQLHEIMVNDFLLERLDKSCCNELKKDYKFNITEGYLQAFYIKLNFDENDFTNSSIEVIKENIEKIFSKEVFSLCFSSAILAKSTNVSGLLNYKKENRDLIRKAIRNCLDYLESQRGLYGDIVYSIGIGNFVETESEIKDTFKNAKNASWERLVEHTGRLFEDISDTKPTFNIEEILTEFQLQIKKCINLNNSTEIIEFIRKLHKNIQQTKNIHGYKIFEIVELLSQSFIEISKIQNTNFINELEKVKSVSELFEKLEIFVLDWFCEYDNKMKNEISLPIRTAKKYVMKNYMKNITLEEVSEIVGFSVTYFSALFKKETGEGFAKYVISVRMEKAKELLQETRIPVSHICELVGYSDLKHFNQTFKKNTNLSPIQYRKLYS